MICKHVAAAAAVNIGLQKMRRAADCSATVKAPTMRFTMRPSMLAASAVPPLQPPTLRGEMYNGLDV